MNIFMMKRIAVITVGFLVIIITGLRINKEKLSERRKNSLVVRELKPDHSLGDVFL